MKVVLIGDSVFDNSPYVAPGESVTDQLLRLLPSETQVELLALDGSLTSQVIDQVATIPEDATHVFVSSGGNDALHAKYTLFPESGLEPVDSVALLAKIQAVFKKDYCRLMDALTGLEVRTTLCTIYSSVPGLEPKHRTALSTFNDVIVAEAARNRVSVLDLRLVCCKPEDFSSVSPIEPSETGGRKIAQKIAKILSVAHGNSRSCIY